MKTSRSTVAKGVNLSTRQHKQSKGVGSYSRRSFKDIQEIFGSEPTE